MKAWTGTEIQEEHDRLERDAATVLGLMIFEYTRLDMELGWLLSWADGGTSLERLTKKLGPLSFSKRLEHLEKSVASKFQGQPEVAATYQDWLSDAHAIRELRNQLFHGRWAVQPIRQVVVNVVGLPNSVDQKGTPYSISDLEGVLIAIRELRARLQGLRSLHPV